MSSNKNPPSLPEGSGGFANDTETILASITIIAHAKRTRFFISLRLKGFSIKSHTCIVGFDGLLSKDIYRSSYAVYIF